MTRLLEPHVNPAGVLAFIRSAQAILLLTAIVKLVTVMTGGELLHNADPVLLVPLGWVLTLSAAGEGLVVGLTLLAKEVRDRLTWVGIACCGFGGYRIALQLFPASRPCPCLDDLSHWMGISDHTAQRLVTGLFLYLLLGTLTAMVALGRSRHSGFCRGARPGRQRASDA